MFNGQRFSALLEGQASSWPADFVELGWKRLKSRCCVCRQDSTSGAEGTFRERLRGRSARVITSAARRPLPPKALDDRSASKCQIGLAWRADRKSTRLNSSHLVIS